MTAAAAGGTHPIGMHSCLQYDLWIHAYRRVFCCCRRPLSGTHVETIPRLPANFAFLFTWCLSQ